MNLSYDKSADVLYISFEKASPRPHVYTENQNGDILKLDRQSGKVIGITLPFFSKRSKAGKIIVPEVGLASLVRSEPLDVLRSPDDLQQELAALGYPGFEHVRSNTVRNPAEVVLSAVVKPDLDTRLVEALPWVLSRYTDLNWEWLRDHAKLNNAQNRLGYLVHLAEQTAGALAVQVLSEWENELEKARLAHEGTLCRDSMPSPERAWLKTARPDAAAHWSLLTSLTAEQLSYV